MATKLVEITESSISLPAYFVTDVFDQGSASSGEGREVKVLSDGTITAFPNYVTVWNMVNGISLSSGDIVAVLETVDETGATQNIAIAKVN